MFLKGDSVILDIKLRSETEGDSPNYNVTGFEDIPRMALESTTIGQLDERLGETHPSRPHPTFHLDPRNRIRVANDSHNHTMSVRDRRQEVLPVPMMMMTLEETSLCIDKPMSVGEPDQVTGEMGSIARQIEEMHLELYEMDINDTTHKQHNIFVQKYIRREIERSCDNPDMTSASMRHQTLNNGGETLEAVPTLPNRGIHLQRDDIWLMNEGVLVETNTRDDTDGTLEGEHEHLQDTHMRPGM